MAQSVGATIFFVYAVVYLLLGTSYDTFTNEGRVGPGFFPGLLAVTLVILTGWNLVRQLILSRRTRDAEPQTEEEKVVARGRISDAFVLLGMILGYIFVMILVGTLIPTFAFMLGVLFYFNRGKALMNTTVALAITVSVWLIFGVAFDADLPTGLFTLFTLP